MDKYAKKIEDIANDYEIRIKQYNTHEDLFKKSLKNNYFEYLKISMLFETLRNQEAEMYSLRIHILNEEKKGYDPPSRLG